MSSTKTKNKSNFFSKIETRDDALKVIKECASAFLVLALIQGVIGAFLFPSLIIDALLMGGLGLALIFFKSRIVAILLFILSSFIVISTVLNRIGVTEQGGTNILLALLIFWASVKAIEATFKLHGKFAGGKSQTTYDTITIDTTDSESTFTSLEWALIAILIILVLFVLGVVVFVYLV